MAKRTGLHIFSLVATIVFLVFAALQFNDNDALIWVAIYLYAAIISFSVFLGKFYAWAYLAGMVGYLFGAVELFPSDVQGWLHQEEAAKGLAMNVPFVEEARESLGLLLCFITMTIYFFRAVAQKKFGFNR